VSADYVRRRYGVPAKRGGRVTVDGRPGVLASFTHRIHVRFDGDRLTTPCHPTWRVVYKDTPASRASTHTGGDVQQ
jgi:hypothetical protein